MKTPQGGDIVEVYATLRVLMTRIKNHNDYIASSHCKHDIYQLKCWLDEQYAQLPQVAGEEAWEQQRIIEKLRRV